MNISFIFSVLLLFVFSALCFAMLNFVVSIHPLNFLFRAFAWCYQDWRIHRFNKKVLQRERWRFFFIYYVFFYNKTTMSRCRSKREIKAQERHINIRSNESGMSVGTNLGRSYNVFQISERPPVRMSGGPVVQSLWSANIRSSWLSRMAK
jgi:hypothetical protein